jgi:hypothetical protein
MKNALALALISLIAAGLLEGCGRGTAVVKEAKQPPPQKNSFAGSIQSNPNMPEAAKKALLNTGRNR